MKPTSRSSSTAFGMTYKTVVTRGGLGTTGPLWVGLSVDWQAVSLCLREEVSRAQGERSPVIRGLMCRHSTKTKLPALHYTLFTALQQWLELAKTAGLAGVHSESLSTCKSWGHYLKMVLSPGKTKPHLPNSRGARQVALTAQPPPTRPYHLLHKGAPSSYLCSSQPTEQDANKQRRFKQVSSHFVFFPLPSCTQP